MKKYLIPDEWRIIEDNFDAENHLASESIFSLGNGKMGQRANFEESYSGPSLQGNYVAGVYYPDKTRVGWWKNGYPEYFAKVLNAPNWVGIDVLIDGEKLDLYTCKVDRFLRVLNMREGSLTREFQVTLPSGQCLRARILRFMSMIHTETALIRYEIEPINFSGNIEYHPYIDGDVKNEDANYDEQFWNIHQVGSKQNYGYVFAETKKTSFYCGFGMKSQLSINGENSSLLPKVVSSEKKIAHHYTFELGKGQVAIIDKYVAVTSSLNHEISDLEKATETAVNAVYEIGFDQMYLQHKKKWAEKWAHSDIVIKGDVKAQQAIRFNIFQLNQTYTGEDERLNVGPKGFTGEKYGGTTYWDTEAYCIPFFLMTSPSQVTRQLLMYRYKHLSKAIENAEKLGFTKGAALYPMVTANGEECHNEWEITFEEIHRNGAIAFAIHNYLRHTGDYSYLFDYGIEVLVAIARFWSQRTTFSEDKGKYVILGVTGPNEYENNVNNNWYTNKLAQWCLKYAIECLDLLKLEAKNKFDALVIKLCLDVALELKHWQDVVENIYLPYNEKLEVIMQQDGFMDKEQMLASELPQSERPINQCWSWDRILRSNFIKQADTLQGIYLFEEEFSIDEIKRNFNFYEPRTVHESSLSPCIHAVLANKIGNVEKAYEMYMRTSRLDLDDYNSEVHEGLHITSMAGTWMSIVEGFGGKRVYDEKLYLSPSIPAAWDMYAFKITFKGVDLVVSVNQKTVSVYSQSDAPFEVCLYGQKYEIAPQSTVEVTR